MGQKKHLKRLPAPKYWPIKRKELKFTTRPVPGPHPKEYSMTLAILLRETLGYAENMREVKAILSSGDVLVDGKPRKDPRYPVGLMDVVEIKSSGDCFRLLPRLQGGLRLVSIGESEKSFKLCRVQKKMMVNGGRLQMTLHDGRNILFPKGEKPTSHHPLETIKVSIPDQKILKTFQLAEGAYAVVSRGKNIGIEGKIVSIDKRFGTHASTVTLQDSGGNKVQTAVEYVFVLGSGKPEISLAPAGGQKK